jgi:hypothetical protein
MIDDPYGMAYRSMEKNNNNINKQTEEGNYCHKAVVYLFKLGTEEEEEVPCIITITITITYISYIRPTTRNYYMNNTHVTKSDND